MKLSSGLKATVAIAVLAGLTLSYGGPAAATCGGGGGGGAGGRPRPHHPVSPGSSVGSSGVQNYGTLRDYNAADMYTVPWQYVEKLADLKGETTLCWLVSVPSEAKTSALASSRDLVLRAGCLSMVCASPSSEVAAKYSAHAKLPMVLLIGPDGSVTDKTGGDGGQLKLADVEKIVQAEMDRRAAAIDQKIEAAKAKASSGDKQGAIDDLRAVFKQHCSSPAQKRHAWDELTKLGVDVTSTIPPSPNFDVGVGARIEKALQYGLDAEDRGHYSEAERYYWQAHRLDPADPVALRYLGELYRHQIGDWKQARQIFDQILALDADPISRAVALHGLGKITVHEGDFKQGLHLMEEAVQTYPLALAYRNLAVYWLSEGDKDKAASYTRQAMAADPDDTYNKVFAATIMAATGHPDDALKVAEENIGLLPASYNLAAIYALNGQKDRALKLLKRHFYKYERYKAVRSEEMMEARVDAVFASLRNDAKFIALTSGADGRLTMPAH